MFEITYNGEEMLRNYKERRIAYKEGKYDFTFEERYLIYHCIHSSFTSSIMDLIS